MEIIRGKQPGAKKTVIYGPEGIGKSTFASRFPEPLFIDTEGSTKDMDVARTRKPSSWTMLLSQIEEVTRTPSICKTLVIDTIDWAEQMCVEAVCEKHHKSGIEDFGYGNGYVYVKEEFGRFLNRLEDVVEAGIHVVLTAHAQLRKFEQPDELGAYDRYELKLGKKTASQTSPLVKEWADMLLFANYKTYSIAADDKGKKHKAQGGKRVMYTSHHPCWDAKNRYGLPDELPFAYEEISRIIEDSRKASESKTVIPDKKENTPSSATNTQPAVPVREGQQMELGQYLNPPEQATKPAENEDYVWESQTEIPKALRDLMAKDCVFEQEIRAVVGARGYYPEGTPIANYDPDFVSGVLVAAWPQVLGMIQQMREKEEIPFN